jgi:hypothetical protein
MSWGIRPAERALDPPISSPTWGHEPPPQVKLDLARLSLTPNTGTIKHHWQQSGLWGTVLEPSATNGSRRITTEG